MQDLLILLVALSLAGRLAALLISTSPASLITTSSEAAVSALFLLLPRSEDNFLMLSRLFVSSVRLHAVWRGTCRKWTREDFLQIRSAITSSPNSLLFQAFLLTPWCIKGLRFDVDSSELVGILGGLPAEISRPLDPIIYLVEELDVYGMWRRNAIIRPKALRIFDNIPLHRLLDPCQVARNENASFQAFLVDYAHKRLQRSDLEAVTGAMFLLLFPTTRSKASDYAKKFMKPGDSEEDQASLSEVMNICKKVIKNSKAAPLHPIATWMVESGILQGEETKEVFPHSLITADSSHEITRLSLLLTLLSGTPSSEFIQTIQARLQECPIIEYIDLLFAMSWTKPATSSFDTLMGSARSRLIGLSMHLLGKSKFIIFSHLTTDERRQMFRTSVSTFADPWFSKLKEQSPESRIGDFYDNIEFESRPPTDFPDAQQFLTTMLEESLTRLVNLRVEKVGGQRTLVLPKEHKKVKHPGDIHAIFLAFYLQLHFEFEGAPPIVVASELRELIDAAKSKALISELSEVNKWV